MKIKSLQLQNFKNFKNAQLKFKDGMNFIVGKNGSGKTNILRAIKFSSACLASKPNIEKYNTNLKITMEIEFSSFETKLIVLCLKSALITDILSNPNLDKVPTDLVVDIVNKLGKEEIQKLFEKLGHSPVFKSGVEEIFHKTNFDIPIDNEATRQAIVYYLIKLDTVDEFAKILNEGKNARIEILKLKGLILNKKEWWINVIFDDLKCEELQELFCNAVLKTEYSDNNFKTKCIFNPSLKLSAENQKNVDSYQDAITAKNGRNYEIVVDEKNKVDTIFERFELDYDSIKSVVNSTLFSFEEIAKEYLVTDKTMGELAIYTLLVKKQGISFRPEQKNHEKLKILDTKIQDITTKIGISFEQKFNFIQPFDMLHQIISSKLYLIPEHRGLLEESNLGLQLFSIKNIAEVLSNWKNSKNPKLREKFVRLRDKFYTIYSMDFDIYDLSAGKRKLQLVSEQKIPVTKEIKYEHFKPSLQFVKNEIPLEPKDASSGAYEVLLSLVLLNEEGDKTLLFDEPGRGLHPQMQKDVSEIISLEQEEGAAASVSIITTHSPFLFEGFLETDLPVWKCIDNKIVKIDLNKINSTKSSGKNNENLTDGQKRFLESPKTITSILFAERMIFVEGISDFQFFSELFSKFKEFGISKTKVDILPTDGMGRLSFATELAKIVQNKYIVICDLDVFFPKPSNSNKKLCDNCKARLCGSCKTALCDSCKEKTGIKQNSKWKPKFRNAEMVGYLGLLESEEEKKCYSEYQDMTYDEIRCKCNTKKLSKFIKAIRKHSVFCWKEGELEDFLKATSTGLDIQRKVTYAQILGYLDQKKEVKGSIFECQTFSALSKELNCHLDL